MQQLRNIKVEGKHGKPVLLDVFYESANSPKPVVVFAHGFKGFKDWGHFNLVAETFARQGFVFVKFNFSHNGTTPEQPEDFADLEAFGNNNFSIELDDLNTVVDWVCEDKRLSGLADLDNISLLGHSRGGAICILQAREDTRVKKLITWSSVAEFGRFWEPEVVAQWQEEGVMWIPNSRTGQQMPMYYQSYENLEANKERLDVLQAAAELKQPWLIVHAIDDPVVQVSAAERLRQAASHAELLLMQNGAHTFNARHPWMEEALPSPSDEVVRRSIAFLKNGAAE